MYLKTWTLVPGGVAVYLYFLFGNYNVLGGIALSFLFGLLLVAIAFNVMHDACHGSYSDRKWINSFMGLSMNALGGNAYLWKIKHNIIHHTYTNIEGVDDDIANGFLLRQTPHQRWRPIHRFQFLYMFFLYAISTIVWAFGTDFLKYFTKKIHKTPINRIGWKEHVLFWASKAAYVFVYALLPMYLLGWEAWLVGFLIIHATMGLALSIVFQLAHAVEKTTFYDASEGDKAFPTEWAVHEIKTTANFAPTNKVISWLTGGLNFQIEHHLFPHVSHVHYPALSKIVRRQCEAFGLPYHYYPTMGKAILSHISLMKTLGESRYPRVKGPF